MLLMPNVSPSLLAGAPTQLASAMLLVAAAAGVAASFIHQKYRIAPKVRMVYRAATATGSSTQQAAQQTDAGSSTITQRMQPSDASSSSSSSSSSQQAGPSQEQISTDAGVDRPDSTGGPGTAAALQTRRAPPHHLLVALPSMRKGLWHDRCMFRAPVQQTLQRKGRVNQHVTCCYRRPVMVQMMGVGAGSTTKVHVAGRPRLGLLQ